MLVVIFTRRPGLAQRMVPPHAFDWAGAVAKVGHAQGIKQLSDRFQAAEEALLGTGGGDRHKDVTTWLQSPMIGDCGSPGFVRFMGSFGPLIRTTLHSFPVSWLWLR